VERREGDEKKMSCNHPIKCKYWDSKEGRCRLSLEEFQKMCERGENPCEVHQEEIDAKAEQEFMEAYYRNDKETMEEIMTSPFTNFGKGGKNDNEINKSF